MNFWFSALSLLTAEFHQYHQQKARALLRGSTILKVQIIGVACLLYLMKSVLWTIFCLDSYLDYWRKMIKHGIPIYPASRNARFVLPTYIICPSFTKCILYSRITEIKKMRNLSRRSTPDEQLCSLFYAEDIWKGLRI